MNPRATPRFISLSPSVSPHGPPAAAYDLTNRRIAPPKRAARSAALFHPFTRFPRSRRRRLFRLCLRLRLRRAGILPLRRGVAIDEFDHRDGSGIAVTEAGFEHSGVAAVAVLVAGTQHVEQLLDHADVSHLRNRLAARMQIAAFGQRDQVLDDWP